MSRYLFVSDTHFGHRGILSPKMQKPRPFATVEEHDEALVAAWNAVVRPADTVWHLGDFAYRCTEDHARNIFRRLNGRKFLVRGNHEKLGERLPWDGPVVDVARIAVPERDGRTTGVFASHYAHRVWPRMHRGDIHFYGHSHGSLMPLPFRSVRRHRRHDALVRRLAEEAHPKSGSSLFPTFRELAVFAAVLGFETGRLQPLDASAPTEIFVDGRPFANSDVAVDVLFLLGLAATRDQAVLLDVPEQEEKLVASFEGFADGGLDVLSEWLRAEPSDPDGDRAIVVALHRHGFLGPGAGKGPTLEDAQF